MRSKKAHKQEAKNFLRRTRRI